MLILRRVLGRGLLIGLLLLVVATVSAARSEAFVYWANGSHRTIGRANLDGSGFDPQFIRLPPGEQNPVAVAVGGTHVYWSEVESDNPRTGVVTSGSISRADLNGSHAEPGLIQTPMGQSPVGLAVGGDHLYWADGGKGIYRSTLDGSEPERIISLPFLYNADSLAVSATHLYWSDFNGGDYVGRANLDGTETDPEWLSDPGRSILKISIQGEHIYWSSWEHGIGRANLDGSEVEPEFIPDTGGPAFSIAVDGEHIYWSLEGNAIKSIGRANLDGSDVRPALITPLGWIGGLALDSGYAPEPAPRPHSGAIPSAQPPPVVGPPEAARPSWLTCIAPGFLESGRTRTIGTPCSSAQVIVTRAWRRPVRAGHVVTVSGFTCRRTRHGTSVAITCTKGTAVVKTSGKLR
ncbi:MAG TPA: DUF5050 domain-containing protein [Solirubrobacterales bacterium]|nr:DUF5050 domain-containing protein [Solirubrobacterales bacterium]